MVRLGASTPMSDRVEQARMEYRRWRARIQSYRHAIDTDSAVATLCGLKASEYPHLEIACECHATECLLPVTCPACIQLRSKAAS